MIGTITAAYYGSEKNASFGKAALIGIGVDIAIGAGVFLLAAVVPALGLGIANLAGRLGGGQGQASTAEEAAEGLGAISAPAIGYRTARAIYYGASPRARYSQLGFQGCHNCLR
jgi:hypothetical protein